MKLHSALIKTVLVLGIEINKVRGKICLKIVYENELKKEDRIGAVDRVFRASLSTIPSLLWAEL